MVFCAGNLPVTGEFPAQRPVTQSFDIFFDLHLNSWGNNGDVGDLRRYRAHYDVIVMIERYRREKTNLPITMLMASCRLPT